MTYTTYAPVDRQFACLERDLPPGAPFNGVDPLDDITFGFALSSRYPLASGVPDVRFGTVAKKPADNPAILLRAISKAEYDAAYAAEMASREAATVAPPEAFGPISDRQFFQALAMPPFSIISTQEALDAVKTGEIPAIMQAVVDQLPADRQFAATMILAGGTTYERSNDLVAVFGASQGMTPAQIDAFWRFAEGL